MQEKDAPMYAVTLPPTQRYTKRHASDMKRNLKGIILESYHILKHYQSTNNKDFHEITQM